MQKKLYFESWTLFHFFFFISLLSWLCQYRYPLTRRSSLHGKCLYASPIFITIVVLLQQYYFQLSLASWPFLFSQLIMYQVHLVSPTLNQHHFILNQHVNMGLYVPHVDPPRWSTRWVNSRIDQLWSDHSPLQPSGSSRPSSCRCVYI